jgi:acyl-CoA synthetase (NDP forming)
MTDPVLTRYAALARRVHALLEEPALAVEAGRSSPAADEAQELLADAAASLALYEAAMPGADATALPDLAALLEALEQELELGQEHSLEHDLAEEPEPQETSLGDRRQLAGR